MTYALNPWHPMSDPVDIKHIGKLGEEINELGAATQRCLIQGIDGAEPVTGKINRQWLQEEIADVLANIELVTKHFNLDREFIAQRSEKKQKHLAAWHKLA